MFSSRTWQAPPVTQRQSRAFVALETTRYRYTPFMSSAADHTFHLVSWPILRRADGRVLLGRRAGVSYGDGLWGLPGGHAEDSETLAQAAARETLEEVGVTVNPPDLTPLGMVRYVDAGLRGADFFFLAGRWEGEPSPVSECSEVSWFVCD